MTYATEVAADSPYLWWRLGEASGTTAADTSGNGRTGTYNGSPTLGATGLVAGGDTAVQFDGTNDYVISAGLSTAVSAFTVEAWFSGAAPAGTDRCLVQRGSSSSQFRIYVRTDGKIDCTVRNSGGSQTIVTSTAVVANGTARHICLVFSASTISVYIDGALDSTGSRSGSTTSANQEFYLGGAGAGVANLTGTIDELAYYTSALSGTRIAAHYAAGFTPAATNVTPTFTAANTQTYAPEIVFGELDVTPGFTAATTQTFPPSVAAGAQRNITVTAAVERERWHAAVIDPDRTAEVQPSRHRAGVTP